MGKGGEKAGFRVMLKYFEIKKTFLVLYKANRLNVAVGLFSNRSQKTSYVVRTSVAHSAVPRVPLFLFLPHFDVISDLLLNRHPATWNLFVLYNSEKPFLHKPKKEGYEELFFDLRT